MNDIVERLRSGGIGQSDRIEAANEIERLRSFVNDVAEHGVRFDLNPTIDSRGADAAYLAYIQRIDKSMRERASDALSVTEQREVDGGR